MILEWISKLGLSTALLAACMLILLAACGSESTPADAPEAVSSSPSPSGQTPGAALTPEPTATPTPPPTPTLTVEEQLSQLLPSVEEKLASLTTATFDMVDEAESGAPFFGTTFKSLSGQVKTPDRFWMLVKVVAPGFGFVEIEMTAVGEKAFIKFSNDAPWTPLPLEQVPFNFGEIGVALAGLLPALSNVSLTGPETAGITGVIGIAGTIASEGMSGLITGVDAGHAVTLTFWVDEAEHTLRKFRIAGRLFDGDAPETVRFLDITGINVPVDIQLPESVAQQ